MSNEPRVFVYGASGYTGKLVAESLASREIPFVAAGRNRERLETSLEIVEERLGRPFEVTVAVSSNAVEELLPLLQEIDVVINVAGPFMQIAWPVVEASLQAGCHYLDTTGEQDWVLAIRDKYGRAFEEKGLLLNPANSYMWAAGAIAAEVVLETEGVDSLDLLYQIDNGLPSEASTKSFLRMVCNDQFYLEQNELKPWPHDVLAKVAAPHRNQILHALPWGGACEPVWFQNDDRVLNCSVLTAIGEHIVPGVKQAIDAFNEQARDLPQEQKEAWTNAVGDQMDSGEPPKDELDVQRSVIVCNGQGRQVTTRFMMNLSAPYTWTGEICAEAAQRLLNGQLKKPGFQSAAQAFGHRELLEAFHPDGFCNLPE
jgi:short subunit dehydrogenase-like uncharacterized protein